MQIFKPDVSSFTFKPFGLGDIYVKNLQYGNFMHN